MIKVNRKIVEPTSFPDGTSSLRLNAVALVDEKTVLIEWYYENDSETMLLYNIVQHIRSLLTTPPKLYLYMPYIPNARMDRKKNDDEIFTLKWFAQFLNSLHFEKVSVLDPHSYVAAALIDNLSEVKIVPWMVDYCLDHVEDGGELLLCYPDEGAAKRYSSNIQKPYIFGVKSRNWKTGKITSLELIGGEKAAGKDVLIVDDICSRGGTFIHTAKALKVAGAKRIYLYVTHCEKTIFDGEILTGDLIEHVFTTNSLRRDEHKKITVMDISSVSIS